MILQRNQAVKTKLLPDGHVVLFNPQGNWAHIVNPIGALVWEFCDGEHSLDGVLGEIREIFQMGHLGNIDWQALEAEVHTFTEELLANGLLSADKEPQFVK